MAIRRIVPNIATPDLEAARRFYVNVIGLTVAMDLGWIVTLTAPEATATPQLSIASHGGSGTPVPDISIEVDDLDEVHRRIQQANLPVEYGPTQEPWGVTRLQLRDPAGRLVNILTHT